MGKPTTESTVVMAKKQASSSIFHHLPFFWNLCAEEKTGMQLFVASSPELCARY